MFGLWKQKWSELNLNMMKYIHGKQRDAKLLEALIAERLKPHINRMCPDIQIGDIAGNTSKEHLIGLKTWTKSNKTKGQI